MWTAFWNKQMKLSSKLVKSLANTDAGIFFTPISLKTTKIITDVILSLYENPLTLLETKTTKWNLT